MSQEYLPAKQEQELLMLEPRKIVLVVFCTTAFALRRSWQSCTRKIRDAASLETARAAATAGFSALRMNASTQSNV
jgi:hypothetical protein